MDRLPFYYEAKMAFILFLIFGDGAQYVFRKLLKPTLALHEESIDLKIDTVKQVRVPRAWRPQ